MKHAIKHRFTGALLFECDVPDDVPSGLRTRYVTSLAVAYLARANLADLAGANLPIRPADATQSIENLDRVRAIVLDNERRLQMDTWHGDAGWRERTCAEEAACETTHCLAGWLQVCSPNQELRDLPAQLAGTLAAPVAARLFFSDGATVLAWLRDRQYVQEAIDLEQGSR